MFWLSIKKLNDNFNVYSIAKSIFEYLCDAFNRYTVYGTKFVNVVVKFLISLALLSPLNCHSKDKFNMDRYWVQSGFLLGSPFFGQTLDIKIQDANIVYGLGVKTQDTSAPCLFNCEIKRNNDITAISSLHVLTGYAINDVWLFETGLALVETKIDYHYIYEESELGLPIRLNKLNTYKYGGFNVSLEFLILENKVVYSANIALAFGHF